eukprot:UN29446
MVRAVYVPDQWRIHRMEVFNAEGTQKIHDVKPHDIVGPLCFSGDIMYRGDLPTVKEGDYLVMRDTGGYTTSMYCLHTNQT